MSDTKDIVQRLQNHYERCEIDIERAVVEIKRLRADLAQRTAERDEARRWYCRSTAQREYTIYLPSANEIDKTARSVAIRFGWDCFEEVKP
jgi:hypothetical protein